MTAPPSFSSAFGKSPSLIVRAPGRINLIGEHTDYSLLPVLPAAIDRAITIEAATDSRVRVISDSQSDPIDADPTDLIRGTGWESYVGAVLDWFGESRGVAVRISGDLPSTGGLSSSSALTVGLVAALANVFDRSMDVGVCVEIAIEIERRVGVESGGMDQTVIGFGRAGHALRIDFAPAARRHVPVGEDLRFVLGYSGEVARKGSNVRDLYNARVVGGRIAALLIARQLGISVPDVPVLGDVARHPETESAAAVLPEILAPRRLSSPDSVVDLEAGRFDADTEVPIRAVAQHVLSEARRVDEFEPALLDGDDAVLGRLLNTSHQSLQRFGASTEALDRVVGAMVGAGAWGARLTGAGFGGYALALCGPEDVERVVAAARAATGGPSFAVRAGAGLSFL